MVAHDTYKLMMSCELSISIYFGITLEYVDPLWPTVLTPSKIAIKTILMLEFTYSFITSSLQTLN
jgi:hypothetical protein